MKLTHVTIVVKDQDKALDFYTQTMGFEKKADYTQPGRPRYLTVSPKGQEIEMVLWPAGAEADRMPASHKQPGIGTRSVLLVEDCRKTFADLKKSGVRFKDSEPLEEDWGIAADLTDPDGNPFTIYQPRAPPPGRDWSQGTKKA
jgi:catechol 2,3-dioxygenase-like lactoylglutathione lyase family enzyme